MAFLRRAAAGAAIGMTIVALGSASAVAAGPGSVYQLPTPYASSYSFDPGCTNISLVVHGKKSGVDTIFNLAGSHGQAFLDLKTYSFKDKWTNPKNGKYFTVQGNGTYQEVGGAFVPKKDVPTFLIPPEGLVGPVYRIRSQDTGINVFRDSKGNPLYTDRGVIFSENLLDTLGDHAPGGLSLDYQVVKVIGPHPSWNVDLCVLAHRLLK